MEMFGANNSRRGNDYTASSSVFDTNNLTWKSGLAWTFAILFVLLGILLFIHYTLYPIFQFQPGGKGLLPIPGFKENRTFWQPTSPLTNPLLDISDQQVFTNGDPMTSNWAFTLDICIICPLKQVIGNQNKPAYRLIFSRGGTTPATITSDTIKGIIESYNVAIALTPATNDLVVSVLDGNSNSVEITIPNIIVNQPFRVGVCLMDMAFEVYLNGKLVKTSTIKRSINSNKGPFHGPQRGSGSATDMTDIVRVGNLNVWSRLASPSEIRYAQPALMPALAADAACTLIGSGAACPSLIGDFTGGEEIGALSTISIAEQSAKLSADYSKYSSAASDVAANIPTVPAAAAVPGTTTVPATTAPATTPATTTAPATTPATTAAPARS